jgi:hypothetical protein
MRWCHRRRVRSFLTVLSEQLSLGSLIGGVQFQHLRDALSHRAPVTGLWKITRSSGTFIAIRLVKPQRESLMYRHHPVASRGSSTHDPREHTMHLVTRGRDDAHEGIEPVMCQTGELVGMANIAVLRRLERRHIVETRPMRDDEHPVLLEYLISRDATPRWCSPSGARAAAIAARTAVRQGEPENGSVEDYFNPSSSSSSDCWRE